MSLTRLQFETSCKEYLRRHHGERDDISLHRYPGGWSWDEHSLVPGLAFLSRSVVLLPLSTHGVSADAGDIVNVEADEPDNAVLDSSPSVLFSHQYVVYSPTFQVPTFYFTLHDGSGSSLSLAQLMTSSFLRLNTLPTTESTSFALTPPDSSFALLSQGDHPTLGTPCWYLHPCHTSEVVGEVMAEVQNVNWSEEERMARWLEIWFMVLSSVVDFSICQ